METRRFDELGDEERGDYLIAFANAYVRLVVAPDARDPSVSVPAYALSRYICGLGPAPELPAPLTDAEIFGWDENEVKS